MNIPLRYCSQDWLRKRIKDCAVDEAILTRSHRTECITQGWSSCIVQDQWTREDIKEQLTKARGIDTEQAKALQEIWEVKSSSRVSATGS